MDIKYEGLIKVKQYSGSTLIAEHVYHNNGTKFLWTFLSSCLCGNYTSAEYDRPFKIKLFYNTDASDTSITTDTTSEASAFISATGIPITQVSEDGNTVKTILHFVIPAAYIFKATNLSIARVTDSEAIKFNQVNLYGLTKSLNSDYSAAFRLEADKAVTDMNTSFIIDWELQFKN